MTCCLQPLCKTVTHTDPSSQLGVGFEKMQKECFNDCFEATKRCLLRISCGDKNWRIRYTNHRHHSLLKRLKATANQNIFRGRFAYCIRATVFYHPNISYSFILTTQLYLDVIYLSHFRHTLRVPHCHSSTSDRPDGSVNETQKTTSVG